VALSNDSSSGVGVTSITVPRLCTPIYYCPKLATADIEQCHPPGAMVVIFFASAMLFLERTESDHTIGKECWHRPWDDGLQWQPRGKRRTLSRGGCRYTIWRFISFATFVLLVSESVKGYTTPYTILYYTILYISLWRMVSDGPPLTPLPHR
jgi:hypothetical protein